jgi:hypothetical protein
LVTYVIYADFFKHADLNNYQLVAVRGVYMNANLQNMMGTLQGYSLHDTIRRQKMIIKRAGFKSSFVSESFKRAYGCIDFCLVWKIVARYRTTTAEAPFAKFFLRLRNNFTISQVLYVFPVSLFESGHYVY